MRSVAASTLLFGLFLSVSVAAEPLPRVTPETVGLSSERLSRITDFLRSDIAKGTIPGAVLLVSRHGKVAYFEAVGQRDPQTNSLMGKDAIFRIYSMSKPITTVCAMMLVEQGKLALGDPVSKYLPEFKDVKVGEEKPGADGKVALELVAAKRPMTVQETSCVIPQGSPTASMARVLSRRLTLPRISTRNPTRLPSSLSAWRA